MTEPRFPRAVTQEVELAADIMCFASSKYPLTVEQSIAMIAHRICNVVNDTGAALATVVAIINDPLLTSEQQIDVSHVMQSAVMGMSMNVRARIELELIHRGREAVTTMLLADLVQPFQVFTVDGAPLSERLHRATDGSAAYDILAQEQIVVTEEAQLIRLGFITRMDHRQAALLLPRSGFGAKWGFALVNTVGLIDSDYPDEWMAKIYLKNVKGVNDAREPLIIPKGERLAQFVLARIDHPDMQHVTDKGDLRPVGRVGGFGSSNIHK